MNDYFHSAILRRVWHTNEQTKHFEFETRDGRFDYRPGQYISMDVSVEDEELLRSYSLASSPDPNGRFDLCLNNIPEGRVSSWLFRLQPGDNIRFTGPYGLFRLREPLDPVSAFIATGTGIAPIRAMLQHLYKRPGSEIADREVWLLFGVRKEADILYRVEFEKLARENANFHFIPTLSRPDPGWTGHMGYVQKRTEQYLQSKQRLHAYVCGLKKMVDDVRRQLRAMGYAPAAVSYEKYD